MKSTYRIICSSCLLIFCLGMVQAKSWRGIVPAKSNRDDVARVVNQAISSETLRFRYESPTEVVEFLFSGREAYDSDCEKALPLGTALLIDIRPKNQLNLSDLQVNQTRLRELEPSADFIIDGRAYMDESEGVVVTTSNGIVERIVYIASRDDQHLCATYYQEPRLFANRIICRLCPTISVSSPDTVEAGNPLSFTATMSSIPNVTYKWTVSGGRITEGQGTTYLTVDTNKLEGKTVTATIEVGGIDPACSNKASSSTPIVPRPRN